MAEPIINETEEEVVSQPAEEPTLGEEPKKKPEKEEQVLFKLEDGNQVNVPVSAIDKFQSQFPKATKVVEVPEVNFHEVEIVGKAPKGKVNIEVTQDDYKKIQDLLVQNDLLATAQSQQKLNEAINTPDPDEQIKVTEYAKANNISEDDAIGIIRSATVQEKLNKLHEDDKVQLDAFAKAYAEKNNLNLDVAKGLVNKVYDDAWNVKNNQDLYQQSAVTAQTILENTPKNARGDYEIDKQNFDTWNQASKAAENAQYQLILGRIERGEYKQALQDINKLEGDQLQNANIESHFAFNQGNKLDRNQYANQRMASSVALQATIMDKMGNYEEAKRLEKLAADNGAYSQGGEGGFDISGGYQQPEQEMYSTYGFSGKSVGDETTPTESSEYMKGIAETLEAPIKRAGQIAETGIELVKSGGQDIYNELYKDYKNGFNLKNRQDIDGLNILAGLLKIGMGASAFTPQGAATFYAFEEAQKNKYTKPILDNLIMAGTTYVTPYLERKGYDKETAANRGLILDITTALLLHGGYNIAKNKVETTKATNKIVEQLRSGNVDEQAIKAIIDRVPEKTRTKIIRKVTSDYLQNPEKSKASLVDNYNKFLNILQTRQKPKKSFYTPQEHPTTISELANGTKVIMKDGTEGVYNVSDAGVKTITDTQGNKTILETEGKASLGDAGIQQVKALVDADLKAQAYVNRPNVGTIIINGKKYLVSLEEGAADGIGDLVFEMDEKGNMYNTFDIHPEKDFSQQRKLDIVNEFRNQKGLGKVTELVEPIPADVEPVSSPDAVTQQIAKLRDVETKEAKRKVTELLAKNPSLKFVYDNMKDILKQLNEGDNFKLKGDCL